MENNNEKKALFSEMVKGRGTVYFLDLRKTKEDKPYVSLTTSRRRKDNPTPERQSIFVFQEDLDLFFAGLEKLAAAKKELVTKQEA